MNGDSIDHPLITHSQSESLPSATSDAEGSDILSSASSSSPSDPESAYDFTGPARRRLGRGVLVTTTISSAPLAPLPLKSSASSSSSSSEEMTTAFFFFAGAAFFFAGAFFATAFFAGAAFFFAALVVAASTFYASTGDEHEQWFGSHRFTEHEKCVIIPLASLSVCRRALPAM